MNSQPDAGQSGTQIELGELLWEGNARALVGDYLDHLCAPLLGVVPYAQRRRLRAEAEDHLLSLTEDFQAEGFTPAEAIIIALKEYGEPWEVGQDWVEAWLCGKSSRLSRITDASALHAFGWFGIFTVLNLLLIEQHLMLPSLIDLSAMTQCLWFASPIAAGALTGMALHPRASRSICRAVVYLSMSSASVGLLLRPHLDGLLFALFQIVFWIPIGCLSSTIASSLRRQLRLQGFLSTAR